MVAGSPLNYGYFQMLDHVNPKPTRVICCDIALEYSKNTPLDLVINSELDLNEVPYPTFKMQRKVGGLVNSSIMHLFPFFSCTSSFVSCFSSDYATIVRNLHCEKFKISFQEAIFSI